MKTFKNEMFLEKEDYESWYNYLKSIDSSLPESPNDLINEKNYNISGYVIYLNSMNIHFTQSLKKGNFYHRFTGPVVISRSGGQKFGNKGSILTEEDWLKLTDVQEFQQYKKLKEKIIKL